VPTSRVSVAWMATVKPQGWVHAALGVGIPRSSIALPNSYKAPPRSDRIDTPGFFLSIMYQMYTSTG